MKKAIVTGGAGFAGCNLVEELLKNEYNVLCVLRPASPHNERLHKLKASQGSALKNLWLMELDMSELRALPELLETGTYSDWAGAAFFHLAWTGGRDDFEAQYANVDVAVAAAEAAKECGCRRIVITGSQAEYGIKSGLTAEDSLPEPFSAYGAAKAAAMYLTKRKAEMLGLEWVWGRIFSLYGRYEPEKTMLRYLVDKLKCRESPELSSCRQNWDYLDATDGARAIIALGERGRSGEIYNIAHGDYRPLREFVETVHGKVGIDVPILYRDKGQEPLVSLQPSVEKIKRDTGWKPEVEFPDGLEI